MNSTFWLLCAALNICVAVLHIIVILVGERAYRYFGAGEWMATQAAAGSWVPMLITSVITGAFFVFAAYNFAGAGYITLPLTMWALAAITLVYSLRGAVVLAIPFMQTPVTSFELWSSFVSLGIGILHAVAFYKTYFVAQMA